MSGAQSSAAERRADVEARIALVQLSGMGPARIRWLLAEHEPIEVVARLRAGAFPVPADEAPPGLQPKHLAGWAADLAKLDSARLYQTQVDKGWTILVPGDSRWPFTDEPEPPLVLFCQGDPDLLSGRPAVAVVGTRRCTSVGRSVAYEMGADLAVGGATVISGLALGVDAAAHHGALDVGGAVIGVVGSGLDVVYPRTNRQLWTDVGASGLLVSEYPAGVQPDRWRFPARNRIIASLSDGVVIVESHATGGSLLTADEAVERGRTVMAVPGAVVNPAADGVNDLIVDGAVPVRHAEDVLAAIGWAGIRPGVNAGENGTDREARHGPDETGVDDQATLGELIRREVAGGSISLDRLVAVSGRSPADVIRAVDRLVDAGVVALDGTTVSWRPPSAE